LRARKESTPASFKTGFFYPGFSTVGAADIVMDITIDITIDIAIVVALRRSLEARAVIRARPRAAIPARRAQAMARAVAEGAPPAAQAHRSSLLPDDFIRERARGRLIFRNSHKSRLLAGGAAKNFARRPDFERGGASVFQNSQFFADHNVVPDDFLPPGGCGRMVGGRRI
jgi:hypothetical protein